MKIIFLDLSIIIFKLTCGIAAISMVGFWIFKFHQNEDVSSIEYISYESHNDITYPEFSICINMPFIYKNLAWGPGSNVSIDEYHRYIEGQSDFREIYRHINYTNVTLNLFDYVQKVIVQLRNETYTIQNLKNAKGCETIESCPNVKFKNNFNGFVNGFITNCFGFEVQFKGAANVTALYLIFKPELKTILQKMVNSGGGHTFAGFSYPRQILKFPERGIPIWTNPNTSDHMISFWVSTNEILRRRNKINDPCFTNWMHFDDMVLTKHHDTVGCSPPYQKSSKPMCASREKLAESRYDLVEMGSKYFPVPCERMSMIPVTADRVHYADLPDTLQLIITYPKTTRMVKQLRSVDLHALIGNIGGYIGLFLGKSDNHTCEKPFAIYES